MIHPIADRHLERTSALASSGQRAGWKSRTGFDDEVWIGSEEKGRELKKRIAMLHFAGPPGVGGVEAVMLHQMDALANLGYRVRLIAGSGASFDDRIETCFDSLLASTHPEVLAVKSDLDGGLVSERFYELQQRLQAVLSAALQGCDVCVSHNVHSLHKNLALTAALRQISTETRLPLVALCYDLAWTNSQYQSELHAGFPWDLLRTAWPHSRYATISESRRSELAGLLNQPPDAISLMPCGLDIVRFLRLSPLAAGLMQRLQLAAVDVILLYPTRLTRRKNIELALRVLAALRALSRRDCRLIVTGPPGPHNPANARYLTELGNLQTQLELEDSVHFLYTCGDLPGEPLFLGDDDVSSCYHLADGLLFTSEQEGFGIPILEAGLAGIPVFCSDIAPLRETAQHEAIYFDPYTSSPEHIAEQIWMNLSDSPRWHLRRRVRQAYRWDTLVQRDLLPLLEA